MGKRNEILVAVPKNYHGAVSLKIGREPNMEKNAEGAYIEKPTAFVSDIKERVLIKNEGEIIKFQSYTYITNNAEDIAYIKGTKIFGIGIWEEKFPKEVAEKMSKLAMEYRRYAFEDKE